MPHMPQPSARDGMQRVSTLLRRLPVQNTLISIGAAGEARRLAGSRPRRPAVSAVATLTASPATAPYCGWQGVQAGAP